MRLGQLLTLFLCSAFIHVIQAQEKQVLIENVKLLDYKTQMLTPPKHVLINGNTIQTISTSPIDVQSKNIVKIDAKGKTLMPGLIDVHVHLVFGALTMPQMMTNDLSEEFLIKTVGLSAQQMLMRGFTSVRDVGGPIFPLKAAIDKGKLLGPRIWPSGAVVSQTAGHGDFRTQEKNRVVFLALSLVRSDMEQHSSPMVVMRF